MIKLTALVWKLQEAMGSGERLKQKVTTATGEGKQIIKSPAT
ncbi:MAG: hypothetical protein AB8A37_07065 [Prochlorococcus sp.]|tara:strand:+ start:1921 stop:2046 length:126 start_codon:yes stop_codon:yes gene_type:complete